MIQACQDIEHLKQIRWGLNQEKGFFVGTLLPTMQVVLGPGIGWEV
jgi:hypothetical protein